MRRWAVSAGLGLMALAVPPQARAQTGTASDPVPVNILFLVDASSSMGECFSADNYDSTGDGVADACTSGSKFAAIKKVLLEASGSLGNAWIGLVQSDPTTGHSGIGSRPDPLGNVTIFREGVVVPLGASAARFNAGVADLTLNTQDAISHGEMLRDAFYYFRDTDRHCDDPTLCSGASAIKYYCQKNVIIVITDGTSGSSYAADQNLGADYFTAFYPASPDVTNTENPTMDNFASALANRDLSTSLTGSQHIETYVMGLDITDGDDISLFQSVADNASTLFTLSDSYDSFRGDLFAVMSEILDGSYQEMPPVLSSTGDKLLMGWYDIRPYRPLYYGQLLGYDIDTDPTSVSYGEVKSDALSPWDAGYILQSRLVQTGEIRESFNYNSGESTRDIYTNIDLDEVPDAFDASNLTALCPLMLDLSVPASGSDPYPGALEGHDLTYDGVVDALDCQELIDFVRGFEFAELRSTGQTRGKWKLGSIRHSQAAIAEPNPSVFTRNPYFREFLQDFIPEQLLYCPDPGKHPDGCDARVAYVTANDGMLHAFNMNTGDELWAYIPRNLLGQTVGDSVERAELLDLKWAEKVLLDATPTVAYVWIDGYEGEGVMGTPDGQQDTLEWTRVLLVGQGDGGRYYLALDITQPDDPYILWEDTAGTDPVLGMGATTSTPAIGLVLDGMEDRWVAFYGSGQEVDGHSTTTGGPGPFSSTTTYDAYVEARLYIRAVGDLQGMSETFSDEGIAVEVDLDGDSLHDGTGFPSNPTTVDRDNDGDTDEVFLVNSAGVVYKFQIDTTDIDSTVGCLFFDPEDAQLDTGATGQYVGKRTSSYWSATASTNAAGQVLMYWGTGSPYDLFNTDRGYFYVVVNPVGCNEGSLFTQCDTDGVVALDIGEKLMGSPIVYDSVVYFTTFAPSADRCTDGQARLYGMDYQQCTASFDTNGTTVAGDGDDLYVDLGAGIPSSPVVANGSIYVATTESVDAGAGSVIRIDGATNGIGSTVSIQWRELF